MVDCMRIIIIGPTLLTRNCIEALLKNGKDKIIAVYTLQDSFATKKARFENMDDFKERGLNIIKISDINSPEVVQQIKDMNPDVIFELGWSQIICPEILNISKKGCIGVHASLLPKNRGAASLNWSIIKGEKKTGVSLFYLAEKPDDGEVIAQKEFSIDDRDDISTLHSKSDLASAELIIENIDDIRNNTVKKLVQNPEEVTYTKRRKPEDGIIDWNLSSSDLYNWIRAQTHPFPGAFSKLKGKKIFIWSSEKTDKQSDKDPGYISSIESKKGIFVSTKDNQILLKRIQHGDGIEMWADDFAEKNEIKTGDFFGD